MSHLHDLITRLAHRDAPRSEANVQADVRSLLLTAPFSLSEGDVEDVNLETPAGERRRIDVETGTTVIEVKRDLRRGKTLLDAVDQLATYVRAREDATGRRYAGVVTDGADWHCYHLTSGGLAETSSLQLRQEKPDVDALLVWLEGVLATAQRIPPLPDEIRKRLGSGSSAHALDQSTLRDLYRQNRDQPDVKIKRQLWARLLTTAFGSQFEDTDELFVEHTLLVNTAEIIAHAVLGLDVAHLPPASLLSGAKFTERGIYGVVEPDFFDWVVDVPRGDRFIGTLARRLARFDWAAVEHDVLKVLYESFIEAKTRKKLGEYYTPDWLAEHMVEVNVEKPLEQRVLDPACGSGTFLFHAVRRYLTAADDAGLGVNESLDGLSRHVLGMDLHPVAVTLARVTYLLAIGPDRIQDPERDIVQVPVFLGDSMQWQQREREFWRAGYLVIQVDEKLNLFDVQLTFPEELLKDARRFDEFVEELTRKATSRAPGSPIPLLRSVLDRFAVSQESRSTVETTFRVLCRLHDEQRNHIWGYYVRNLARPVWLARPENRVDVVIGNPPWLAYRHMTGDMQTSFKVMSESRTLWHGSKVSTHQDLSALFVVRTVELYLRAGGRFSFVMPNAVLDRAQFAGFRRGSYAVSYDIVNLHFDIPWDLRRLRPHFFPRGSSVVSGTRSDRLSKSMPTTAEGWSGRVDKGGNDWASMSPHIQRQQVRLRAVDQETESPYRERFRQGASVVPRVLCLVEAAPAGPLGLRAGTTAVRSVRSAYEKAPWKDLRSRDAIVETEFIHPLLLGEHVLHYHTLAPAAAVLPWQGGRLLTPAQLERYPNLAKWWRDVDQLWLDNRSSERLSLLDQLDYHSKLSAQHPPSSDRIVYAKSGMHLAAARISDRRVVLDHKLYWASAQGPEEARLSRRHSERG